MSLDAFGLVASLAIAIVAELELAHALVEHGPSYVRYLVGRARRRWCCPRGWHRDVVMLDTTWMYYQCVDCRSVRELGNVVYGVSNLRGFLPLARRRRKR